MASLVSSSARRDRSSAKYTALKDLRYSPPSEVYTHDRDRNCGSRLPACVRAERRLSVARVDLLGKVQDRDFLDGTRLRLAVARSACFRRGRPPAKEHGSSRWSRWWSEKGTSAVDLNSLALPRRRCSRRGLAEGVELTAAATCGERTPARLLVDRGSAAVVVRCCPRLGSWRGLGHTQYAGEGLARAYSRRGVAGRARQRLMPAIRRKRVTRVVAGERYEGVARENAGQEDGGVSDGLRGVFSLSYVIISDPIFLINKRMRRDACSQICSPEENV
ncbi:eukaryotic translation initiation factor 3subunit F-2 [Striga asiatica]|uniref:Eukaryotic translation initiation factor 3subunit F-2 n=1 Tax=Striga asiatica TaxID=4170 RepID=A0A5A7QG96_STRAF|nr:eukaryotic translation initiation factor 3subunit F-2 [Striga asiatica]